MKLDIEVKGLDELRRKMDKRGADIRPALREATDTAVKFTWGTIPGYPPPPPNSRYRRTGTLGRTNYTEMRDLGTSVVGVLGNNTEYAPDVISLEAVGSRGPQMAVHQRTGWYTLQKVVADAHEKIVSIYQQAISKLLGE